MSRKAWRELNGQCECIDEDTPGCAIGCEEGVFLTTTEYVKETELLACGHRKKDNDDSYGGCVFCTYKNGYEEQDDAIDRWEEALKEIAELPAERQDEAAWIAEQALTS